MSIAWFMISWAHRTRCGVCHIYHCTKSLEWPTTWTPHQHFTSTTVIANHKTSLRVYVIQLRLCQLKFSETRTHQHWVCGCSRVCVRVCVFARVCVWLWVCVWGWCVWLWGCIRVGVCIKTYPIASLSDRCISGNLIRIGQASIAIVP